ncbi:divergent polysaccharide deacetylase family protein [Rickettsia endosymbiont of Cardiosporidium cionae]|uniref:divergent polysaccharide deacetylase family protein n=1 Tax=Rickettsia endosymbiont of Cardiosporidium cionae TaxID=2777155 RepID=UPI00189611FF|nr:divergent polysaccharide deacetylase family protein [Rickettsia endosymbiont of Cardiosporidium cionae]KAF8818325.1 hypothetical protein IHI24_000785 [Rickettsia endosymbiont of Cardiosporidium cionae]
MDQRFLSKNFKQLLVTINVALAFLSIASVIFWVLVIRPYHIKKSILMEHLHVFDINDLPSTSYHRIISDHQSGQLYFNKNSASDKLFSDINNENIDSELEKNYRLSDQKFADNNSNKISILITNLGVNDKISNLALKLPKEFAFGVLPFSNKSMNFVSKARSSGNEIYLYIPMEENSRNEDSVYNKYKLLSSISSEENHTRLLNILSVHNYYDGIYSSNKEMFTSDINSALILLKAITSKKLKFILGNKSEKLSHINFDSDAKLLVSDVVIDDDLDRDTIANNLSKLIAISKAKGTAIGYARSFKLTLDEIQKWLPTLKSHNIDLISISELIKLKKNNLSY